MPPQLKRSSYIHLGVAVILISQHGGSGEEVCSAPHGVGSRERGAPALSSRLGALLSWPGEAEVVCLHPIFVGSEGYLVSHQRRQLRPNVS